MQAPAEVKNYVMEVHARSNKPFSETEDAALMRMKQLNVPFKAMAGAVQRSEASVRNRLQVIEYGPHPRRRMRFVPLRDGQPFHFAEDAALRRLAEMQWLSWSAIGELLERSEGNVWARWETLAMDDMHGLLSDSTVPDTAETDAVTAAALL